MVNENMSDDISDLLVDKVASINRARGALTALFRKILLDLNIQQKRWERLMEKYLNEPSRNIPKSGRKRSSERGNLNKQLARDPMTSKNFIKGLKFLCCKHAQFEVKLTIDGKVTTHGIDILTEGKENEAESMLFKKILLDLEIGPKEWDKLMEDYLNDPINEVPKYGKKRSGDKGGLNKQLTKPDMSFKNFMRGLRFLGCTHVRFEVTLTIGKKTTVHWVELVVSKLEG